MEIDPIFLRHRKGWVPSPSPSQQQIRPALCVVDALIAGEGDGPVANLARWCGCILASTDPVATDVTIARLMGRDWTRLEFAKAAEQRGLGLREPITYVGVPLDAVAFQVTCSANGCAR